MSPVEFFALGLAAMLVVSGIVLVLVAFVISQLEKARKRKQRGAIPHADIFDVLVELAKRLPLIFVPGVVMIGLGVALAIAVVVAAGPTQPAG